MKRRTGLFPYVLGAIWAALVILALVEMANFSAAIQRPDSTAARPNAARIMQARSPRNGM